MLTQEEDQQLVERVQRGDTRAFDLLVLKYQHKILGLIVRFVHDTHEAQDVAQEAFIKAYRALGNFRGDSAFYTWLYRIAINTAKNYLVSRGRRPPDSDVRSEDAEFYDGDHGLKADSYTQVASCCLLYTSDAADDMQCVDLGGRRIIKKKKNKKKIK